MKSGRVKWRPIATFVAVAAGKSIRMAISRLRRLHREPLLQVKAASSLESYDTRGEASPCDFDSEESPSDSDSGPDERAVGFG